MKDKIAVLGCGPAGLLAAHAVQLSGNTPYIFSKKERSQIGGAQFLHVPIKDITEDKPDGVVNFIKYGTEEGYAKKIYGDPSAPTSWGSYPEGTVDIWSLRDAYDKLWALYEQFIHDFYLDYTTVASLLQTFGRVVSTVPMPAICHGHSGCKFTEQEVWIVYGKSDAEEGDDRIIYDGTGDFPWYRWSYLFGWKGVEFAHQVSGAMRVRKPLASTCQCHPSLLRLGRYGTWTKGVLAHEAFIGAQNAL